MSSYVKQSMVRLLAISVAATGALIGGGLGFAVKSAEQQDQQPKAAPALKYARGHKAHKNAAHLRAIKADEHGAMLRKLYKQLNPPDKWDSKAMGWISPIQDQKQCGSCFPGDTMIRMADGAYQRIDQIKVGDMVISAEGNVRTVSHTMKRPVSETLVKMFVSGHYQLEATSEHPILTEDGYVPIGEIRPGQFVAIPRFLPGVTQYAPRCGELARLPIDSSMSFPFGGSPERETEAPLKLTYGLGRLLGLYVAEGSASGADRKVIWSLSINEVNTLAAEIVTLCRSELGVSATIEMLPDKGGCRVRVNSASLEREFLSWFGSGPQYKTVPGCFMSGNPDFLAGFLAGWIDGDRQRGESAVTVSPVLALQMHDIANYLGFMPSLLIHTEAKTDKRGIPHLRSWRVGLNNPETYKRGAAKLTDTHLWRKVTAIGDGEYHEGYVYNLEVEGDHSYTANGIGVHNCWDFSGSRVVDTAYNVARIGPNAGAWLFSEQYTLDCGNNGGCNGDDNVTVLQWAKNNGLPTQADYGAYTASSGHCKWSKQTLYKITDWGYSDPNGSQGVTGAEFIKKSIMAYGGVGCAVAAGGDWDGYNGGVFVGSGSHSIDHDVFLRGWDDTMSKTAGKTVWIMDNSWGPGWGDKGSMYIQEGADDIGTEAVWATVTNPAPIFYPYAPRKTETRFALKRWSDDAASNLALAP